MLKFVITGYVEKALFQAEYDKLEDGTFSGRIPSCKGVIAFGKTLRECEDELRSTLEDWVLVGLKLGHNLPVLGECDLNEKQRLTIPCERLPIRKAFRERLLSQIEAVANGERGEPFEDVVRQLGLEYRSIQNYQ